MVRRPEPDRNATPAQLRARLRYWQDRAHDLNRRLIAERAARLRWARRYGIVARSMGKIARELDRAEKLIEQVNRTMQSREEDRWRWPF